MEAKGSKITVVLCCLALFVLAGCQGIDALNMAGPGQPYSWLTDEERAAQANRSTIISDSDDNYWKNEWEIQKLKRLEEQQRRESAAIREHTRRMLPKKR